MHCLIGLGNPGPGYAETRHNVGFRVVDTLAEHHGIRLPRPRSLAVLTLGGGRLRAQVGEGRMGDQPVRLVKPETFMNKSGEAVVRVCDKFELAPPDLLIIYDDLDLALGTLRLRRGGSPGTHRGMRSVVERLGTEDIPRLRLGIGPLPAEADAREFVMSPFTDAEVPTVDPMLARGVEAVEYLLTEGIDAAMNKFNIGSDSE